MNYGQFQDRVLQLVDQYSVAGVRVAATYNNQQDYLHKIPGLLNDALREICTTRRKLPAVLTLSAETGERLGETLRFRMPDNFFQFRTGDSFVSAEDGTPLHTNLYSLLGQRFLLVPAGELDEGRSYTVVYYRYPETLPEKPPRSAELDGPPEAQEAAVFYAAAFLAVRDDPFLYAALYNKYEDKLEKLSPGLSAEVVPPSTSGGNWGVYEC